MLRAGRIELFTARVLCRASYRATRVLGTALAMLVQIQCVYKQCNSVTQQPIFQET